MELDEEDAELRNPFPSPPSHYTNYTNHNLKLLRLLKERSGDVPPSNIHQREVLSDQHDVPEWPLTQLEKPRADWILEDPSGSYEVFGDRWFVRLIIFTRSQYILSESFGRSRNRFLRWPSWADTSCTRPTLALACCLYFYIQIVNAHISHRKTVDLLFCLFFAR